MALGSKTTEWWNAVGTVVAAALAVPALVLSVVNFKNERAAERRAFAARVTFWWQQVGSSQELRVQNRTVDPIPVWFVDGRDVPMIAGHSSDRIVEIHAVGSVPPCTIAKVKKQLYGVLSDRLGIILADPNGRYWVRSSQGGIQPVSDAKRDRLEKAVENTGTAQYFAPKIPLLEEITEASDCSSPS